MIIQHVGQSSGRLYTAGMVVKMKMFPTTKSET